MSFLYPSPVANLSSNVSASYPYPTDGLIALYNIAESTCYTSGSSTVKDLSGYNNHLTISGNVSYLAASSSLLVTSSGNLYSTFGSISSVNSLQGGNLNGTGSVFTVITFLQSWDGQDYAPLWYIGDWQTGTQKQIANYQLANFVTWKMGIGTATNDYYYPWASSAAEDIWAWGDPYDPTYGYRRWSLQAFAKSSQASTNNLRIDARGYYTYSVDTFSSSSLGSVTLNNASYPKAIGNSLQTTFSTNLDTSILYIGKNPATPSSPTGTVPAFLFGGMAIYTRVLTTSEVDSFWTYFNNGR